MIRTTPDLLSLEPKWVLEHMTGEMYARFLRDNAERWQRWAAETPGVSIAHYDLRSMMDWALHFEKVVPALMGAISGLLFRRYQEPDGAIVFEAKFREVWKQENPDGLAVSHYRDYEAKVSVSLPMLLAPRDEMREDFMRDELQRMMILGLVDAFEKYQQEGKHKIMPAQAVLDPLSVVML